ncbi:MAG: hypothetical protein WBD20_21515 [Pirellulaceae bacterium]
MMKTTTLQTTDEKIIALVQSELVSNRRWIHRLALLGASTMFAIVLALWTTEPRPLATKLHLAFAIMSVIAVGWILVLGNILLRKNCPTSWDRIATAWMSVAGCSTFLIASQFVTWLRGDMAAMATLGILGGGMLLLAIHMVRNAYRWQDRLRQRLSELDD